MPYCVIFHSKEPLARANGLKFDHIKNNSDEDAQGKVSEELYVLVDIIYTIYVSVYVAEKLSSGRFVR